jgi:hypothetical protein
VTQWIHKVAKMDIKKHSKTLQSKREEYVVLELAVQPGPSYSIPTTYVVDVSSLFMMLAAGQLIKMTTGFVPHLFFCNRDRARAR